MGVQLQHDLLVAILSSLPLANYDSTEHTTFSMSLDPVHLWKKFSVAMELSPETHEAVTAELESSLEWQSIHSSILFSFSANPPLEHAYDNCPKRPTLELSSIKWEHALVEGHPTHPVSSRPIPLTFY